MVPEIQLNVSREIFDEGMVWWLNISWEEHTLEPYNTSTYTKGTVPMDILYRMSNVVVDAHLVIQARLILHWCELSILPLSITTAAV